MNLAIITDSTCDLSAKELGALGVERVPLYVNFKGEVYKDWLEIGPKEIAQGVEAGANIPTTSQPSPQDFTNAYQEAVDRGWRGRDSCASPSRLSCPGPISLLTVAKESVSANVHVFDSLAASVGIAMMLERAVKMRDAGESIEAIMDELKRIRDHNLLRFTVGSLDFLQKNGRIGGAQALLGGLLKIKPILGLVEGRVEAVGRVRGEKKARGEIVSQAKEFVQKEGGSAVVYFLHIQNLEAAEVMREQLEESGLTFRNAGTYEIGAVIASHVGPGTYGVYLYTE